jgi:hypothetical protein
MCGFMVLYGVYYTIYLIWSQDSVQRCTYSGSSNGKSSIVAERLYSFFFALLKKKTKLRFFSFFSFFTSINDVRFASIV